MRASGNLPPSKGPFGDCCTRGGHQRRGVWTRPLAVPVGGGIRCVSLTGFNMESTAHFKPQAAVLRGPCHAFPQHRGHCRAQGEPSLAGKHQRSGLISHLLLTPNIPGVKGLPDSFPTPSENGATLQLSERFGSGFEPWVTGVLDVLLGCTSRPDTGLQVPQRSRSPRPRS